MGYAARTRGISDRTDHGVGAGGLLAALEGAKRGVERFFTARTGDRCGFPCAAGSSASDLGVYALRPVVAEKPAQVGARGRDSAGDTARLPAVGLAELPDIQCGLFHTQQPGRGVAPRL